MIGRSRTRCLAKKQCPVLNLLIMVIQETMARIAGLDIDVTYDGQQYEARGDHKRNILYSVSFCLFIVFCCDLCVFDERASTASYGRLRRLCVLCGLCIRGTLYVFSHRIHFIFFIEFIRSKTKFSVQSESTTSRRLNGS